MRLTHPATLDVKDYNWSREKFCGHSLSGQTLGILGLGRLGKMMARYGNAFNMKVITHDPYIEEEIFKENNCKKVDFDKLIKQSDVISIHVHLNSETENILNKERFY